MVRKLVLLTMVSAIALATIPVAAARTGVSSSALYQSDDETSEEPTLDLSQDEATLSENEPTPVVVEELDLGERYTNDMFALEVQGYLTTESIDHQELVAVRASVALQNLSGGPMTYTPTALTGEGNYPALQLVDSAGEIYPINIRNPQRYAIAGSNLHFIPDGLPAHWTVGWQIPRAQASDMLIQAVWNGNVVAEWDMDSTPSRLEGWDAPDELATLESGDSLEWSTDGNDRTVLTVEVGNSYANSCGHPDLVVSAAVGYVGINITNEATREAYFPGVEYPDVPMYAVWADGSSARYNDHYYFYAIDEATVAFPADFGPDSAKVNLDDLDEFIAEENATFFDEHGFNSEILERRASEHIVYPEETERRLAMFQLPRFSPLVNQMAPPVAVVLIPPTGESVWIDLDQVERFDRDILAGDVFLPDCSVVTPSIPLDLGFFGGEYNVVLPLVEVVDPLAGDGI